MKETAEEKPAGSFFTKVPPDWSARKDVPLPMKVIVAYIYTRANIGTLDWELVSADIVNQWGLAKSTVSKVIKALEKKGVIHFTEYRKIDGQWPYKIYRIDRVALENLMNAPAEPVHKANRYGSSCEPPRFNRRTATVHVANLEEDNKKKIEKKSTKEEPKNEGSTECSSFKNNMVPVPKQSAVVEEFLSKSPKEQNEWLDDVEANKTLVRDLRRGKDVRWTKEFEDYFANM